jgi:drug/metabolite transporter (DMT)-like permease
MADVASYANELERRVKTLPEFFQPIAYGALVTLFFMGVRGALVVFPIAVVCVLVTSKTPVADLTMGAGLVLLAILGGAFSGLSYSVIGKYLRRSGTVGAYLAGITMVAPYMLVLALLGLDEKPPTLVHSPDGWDYAIAAFFSVFFGSIFGAGFSRTDRAKRGGGEHAT